MIQTSMTMKKKSKPSLTPPKSSRVLMRVKKKSLASPKISKKPIETSVSLAKSLPESSTPTSVKTLNQAPEALPTQSVENILDQSQAQAPKRKRGRPPKAETLARLEAQGVSEAAPQSSGPVLAPPVAPSAPIPKEALAPLIEAPFKAAALRTGYADFNLTAEERDGLVPLVDVVIRQYLGESQSPHAPLYTLCGTLALFAGVRTMGYLQWRRDQIEAWNQAQAPKNAGPAGLPNENRTV